MLKETTGAFDGLEHTTSTLRVRCATHCATPPLNSCYKSLYQIRTHVRSYIYETRRSIRQLFIQPFKCVQIVLEALSQEKHNATMVSTFQTRPKNVLPRSLLWYFLAESSKFFTLLLTWELLEPRSYIYCTNIVILEREIYWDESNSQIKYM